MANSFCNPVISSPFSGRGLGLLCFVFAERTTGSMSGGRGRLLLPSLRSRSVRVPSVLAMVGWTTVGSADMEGRVKASLCTRRK